MSDLTSRGYAGKILRVDLTGGDFTEETPKEAVLKKWIGGLGLAAKYLYDEVSPETGWDDPDNLLIWNTGPLAGTTIPGGATMNFMTKGPMTNQAVSTQANGFMGAYLKFQGYDGIIFKGQAAKLSYLIIRDGRPELRDAAHLAGLDFAEVEDKLRLELGVKGKQVSIFGIGPAGENLVRFAAITGDHGHVASKGGIGAVMGKKNLKAVVVFDGKPDYTTADPDALKAVGKKMFEASRAFGPIYEWGSAGGFSGLAGFGALPVKNYTTGLYPEHETMNGQYLRTHFDIRPMPCYRCATAHVKEVTVTEGPYKGFVGEEPEYEQIAAWGPQIGAADLGAATMLGNEVDKLGMDCNESSWVVGWVMECFEKGVFTPEDADGLEISWGDIEATKELLNRIARRQGKFADMLAEGVMRASQKVGPPAADWAVYGRKGNSPRGHDHRGKTRWYELFDTCVSSVATLEATWGGVHPQLVDQPAPEDSWSHEEVSTVCANFAGVRLVDDCVGTCRFASPDPKQIVDGIKAATGWDWTLEDSFTLGRRIMSLMRVFAYRHGMNPADERPSVRYGEVPPDGPAEGVDIMAGWDDMLKNYRSRLGWDEETGKPLPETLRRLDLEECIGNF